MESLSVVNGNTFIIGNGGSSGARMLTLGNTGTQTVSLVFAQPGNFSVGSSASLPIASAISGANDGITKTGAGTLTSLRD